MKLALVLAAALLSGCVVAPLEPSVSVGVTARIGYPVSVSAYLFDPNIRVYYFMNGGQRYYMPRDWHPRKGPPPGHYRGKKKGHRHWGHD